jgi:electron transfer flavoprotein beta subunit
MRLLVAVKQVPDTTDVVMDPERGTMIRDGVPSILNPFDAYAIEEALRWRDELGGTVTVLTMGPPQAEAVLREAVSMGVDEAVLLSDPDFAGSDTWATSNTIAAAVSKLGDIDLVLTGKQAIDGDTAQTGPGIAASLDWPQVTFVGKVRELSDGHIVAERYVEGAVEVVRSSLPAVITVLKDANSPRLPSLKGKMRARKLEIPVMGRRDLDLSGEETGLEGSPTRVIGIATPEVKASGEIHRGEPEELARLIADRLLGEEA